MSYTKANLLEVDDVAAAHGFGEAHEARFARGALDAQDTGLAHFRLRAGKRQPFAHRHGAAEEIYVVLSGSGRVRLDDDIVELGPLDAVRVAPGVTRRFEAGPHGMEFLAVGPHREGDGEVVQGFWED
jgi:mannose-6-phosphate isomerase-like protein (cupin superfamily)